jgi:5,10-methylenetetrahydromethanopterin reductase
MRIGMGHGDDGSRTLEQQVQAVVDDENDGFDLAWFSQIMGGDSLTMIALAGQRTSRIAFGTAVIPTYPRHPFALAQQALTVQAATTGRLTLGIGPSHAIVIENMWGLSYEKPARHMREYLSVLLPLLNARKVSFKGEDYRVNGAIGTKVEKAPSVIISALAPMMLKIAGSMADGTVLWMTGPKTIEAHVVPSITAAAKEAGRPAPRVVASFPVCVTEDAAAARETCAKFFAIYGQLPNYRRMLDREGAAGPADVAIVGDEAAVERQVRAVASAGATDFLVSAFPTGSDLGASMARTRTLVKSLIGKV